MMEGQAPLFYTPWAAVDGAPLWSLSQTLTPNSKKYVPTPLNRKKKGMWHQPGQIELTMRDSAWLCMNVNDHIFYQALPPAPPSLVCQPLPAAVGAFQLPPSPPLSKPALLSKPPLSKPPLSKPPLPASPASSSTTGLGHLDLKWPISEQFMHLTRLMSRGLGQSLAT